MATSTKCRSVISVDELKLKTGITDQHLDSRLLELEDGFLLELADLFGTYEQYVHALPGLSEGDKADVKESAKNGNKLGVFKALTLWRKRNAIVTLRSLIEILLSLRECDLCHQICVRGMLPTCIGACL